MNASVKLAAMQDYFWSAVHEEDLALEQYIHVSDEFTEQQRVDVYRTTTRSVKVMSLMDTYSVCKKILGEQYFKQLAKQYAQHAPFLNPDMNQYGATFPDYLNKLCNQRDELKEYAYLPDLARLEWFYQAAYFAKDNIPFDADLFLDVSKRCGDKLTLSLQACIYPICTAYPIYEIWNMHRDNELEKKLISLDAPQYLCVHRSKFEVKVVLIDVGVYVLLSLISEKKTLLEITQQFSKKHNLDQALAFVMQKQWIKI